MEGTTFRYDALYYDLVPDRRIVYACEMSAGGARISVSLVTVVFAESDGGTNLTYTEQGVYLDGVDGSAAPRLREGGTAEMLDNLTRYRASRAGG